MATVFRETGRFDTLGTQRGHRLVSSGSDLVPARPGLSRMGRVLCALLVSLAVFVVSSSDRASAEDVDHAIIQDMTVIGEDVAVVLNWLASQADGLNIFVDGSVRGTMSQNIKSMPVIDAITYVARVNGYSVYRDGNVIVVATAERIAQMFDAPKSDPKRIVEVIDLDYVAPADIMPAVSLIIPSTDMKEGTRGKSIVVSGTEDQIEQVKDLVARLDRPSRQVFVQAKIVEVATSAIKNLGLKWDGIGVKVQRDSVGLITGAFVDVNPLLGFLEDNGLARTVASPELRVADGESGRILLGDRIPVKTTTKADDGTVTESWNYAEAGVRLEVTPSIRSDGSVSMKLKPEISSVESLTADNLPWLKTREQETTIIMKDGQTVAIGGLLQTQELESIFKVPFLGSIPILGEAFQRKDTTVKETDLVIFITAIVIDEKMDLTLDVETLQQMAEVQSGSLAGTAGSGVVSSKSLVSEGSSSSSGTSSTDLLDLLRQQPQARDVQILPEEPPGSTNDQ